MIGTCNLQYADAAQLHTIESACQGFLSYYCVLSLSCYVLMVKTGFSFPDTPYIFASKIHFETKEGPNGYMQRAWDELEGPDGRVIPRDRILIYCMCVHSLNLLLVKLLFSVPAPTLLCSIKIFCRNHEIIKKLGTPKWNHIIFPKKLCVPKIHVDPPSEEDISEEEELLDDASPEPTQSPSSVASNQNQCSCSSPINSFAPASLFMGPYPGTCGWLGD